jgi:hypothetical protein
MIETVAAIGLFFGAAALIIRRTGKRGARGLMSSKPSTARQRIRARWPAQQPEYRKRGGRVYSGCMRLR